MAIVDGNKCVSFILKHKRKCCGRNMQTNKVDCQYHLLHFLDTKLLFSIKIKSEYSIKWYMCIGMNWSAIVNKFNWWHEIHTNTLNHTYVRICSISHRLQHFSLRFLLFALFICLSGLLFIFLVKATYIFLILVWFVIFVLFARIC